jgi:transient receptor potential cation channel subfamily M protein 2
MIKYMYENMGMPPPKLILSVTGGAKNFTIPHRMKKAFKEGLIKAAATTDAWIITGGTNTGVMRLVGEAVEEEYPKYPADTELTVLGIATWEVIAMREKLMREDSVRYELIKAGRAFLLGKWGK